MKKSGKKVRFDVTAERGAKVMLAGSFNGWDPEKNPMKEVAKGGVYSTDVVVPAGRHEYKFVVNGQWRLDPNAADVAENGYGTLNSVLLV